MDNQQNSQTVRHTINGHTFDSTYTIKTISGYNGQTFVDVNVSHRDIDLDVVIASNNICTKINPKEAWEKYRSAIANKSWGAM